MKKPMTEGSTNRYPVRAWRRAHLLRFPATAACGAAVAGTVCVLAILGDGRVDLVVGGFQRRGDVGAGVDGGHRLLERAVQRGEEGRRAPRLGVVDLVVEELRVRFAGGERLRLLCSQGRGVRGSRLSPRLLRVLAGKFLDQLP